MQIVECVPNFSEGRDEQIIAQITGAIASVKGVRLLHVDVGKSANRTVVTFIGTPDAIGEAAFRGIHRASQIIDMREHRGTHPRMGATDVCPFIPVRDISMEAVDAIARDVAQRVGEELQIPVFLYEQSAASPERRNLADIRRGGYEGMATKIQQTAWQPDYGPAELHRRAGVTAIGAREFLIAYNINLATRNADIARDIAGELRESGRVVRTGKSEPLYLAGDIRRHTDKNMFCGSCVFAATHIDTLEAHTLSEHDYSVIELLEKRRMSTDALSGTPVLKPGQFPYVKAIGWFVEEYDCAQISTNLTNQKVTPPHRVFEAARVEAENRGIKVTGSEIIGLIPYDALQLAGKFYLNQQGLASEGSAEKVINTAVESLGLNDKTPFKVAEKVLGFPGTEFNLEK
jgi:glutamate formiminotransferase/formiminotetrahydrofolate cyclodeaminase